MCRCDGIGRRSGLKIHRWRHRAGSSPATGTNQSLTPLGSGIDLYRGERDRARTRSHRKQEHPTRGAPQLVKKASRSSPPQRRKNCNHFLPRRVRGRKYFTACKRGSYLPEADNECAAASRSHLSKSPKGGSTVSGAPHTGCSSVHFNFLPHLGQYSKASSTLLPQ